MAKSYPQLDDDNAPFESSYMDLAAAMFEEESPSFLLVRADVAHPLQGYTDVILMRGTTLLFMLSDNRSAVFANNVTTPA